MGYKKFDQNLSFAELALSSSMENNRSLKMMERINQVVDWSNIEDLLAKHYDAGTKKEGADAYPPLMLLKGMLLQKWFHIPSDPELENQINDRISFKKFLGLSFNKPSPDHSTFSRFRARLSKEATTAINHEVLFHFSRQGLTINEGVAVDARLVQSSSHPIKNEKLHELRKKRNTPEGNLDKHGKPLKFSKDIESNCTVMSRHADSIKKVYADKGYFGKPNQTFLHMNNIEDGIMRKDTTTAKLTTYEKERNKKISKKRYNALDQSSP